MMVSFYRIITRMLDEACRNRGPPVAQETELTFGSATRKANLLSPGNNNPKTSLYLSFPEIKKVKKKYV